uniref:Uncharacterized protein n=1 Tax=Cacopsylla melanoneura TaxID=428564 RepID=A0A8D8ZHR9_9HEMI
MVVLVVVVLVTDLSWLFLSTLFLSTLFLSVLVSDGRMFSLECTFLTCLLMTVSDFSFKGENLDLLSAIILLERISARESFLPSYLRLTFSGDFLVGDCLTGDFLIGDACLVGDFLTGDFESPFSGDLLLEIVLPEIFGQT